MSDRDVSLGPPRGGVLSWLGLAGHPRGLGVLFFAEMWERFSYYGMRALLVLFMVAPVTEGGLGFTPAEAALIYGNYTMAVYLLSIPGGVAADTFLGLWRAVIIGGIVIAAGHFTLAVADMTAFYAGLILVVLGTGLFKPSVSALVGTLYGAEDTRRDAGFSLFYMGINVGGFFAPLVTGFLAQSAPMKAWLAAQGLDPLASWHWGFAAAGIGMVLGLAILLLFGRDLAGRSPPPGREEPRHGQSPTTAVREPPSPWLSFTTWEGRSVLSTLVAVIAGTLGLMALIVLSDRPGFELLRWAYVLVPAALALWLGLSQDEERRRYGAMFVLLIGAVLFWAIFEQAGLTIALFADQLTRSEIAGWTFPSAWFQSLNPLFVILLAPFFAALWMRLGDRQPSTPVKFGAALVFLALSFLLMVPAATLTAEGRISPLWLVGLFFLQTVGELLLSPVGLSTMTKLAPKRAVGLVLGIWLLGFALGSKLAGVLGSNFTATDPGALAWSFLWQAGLAAAMAAVFFVLAPWVKRLMGGIN
ncbi:peptide MFS transporter [Hyphomicrobium sp.]|uniref:peptide MFS transporter n=1 Tax=Hyphomicrobium sp. TaxID=82 RepID=UPI0025BF26D2|nr:peptide MFS transporter [Hyphomicrobium sp.]MCC7251344.1 peptide MFS transporter [Hyphomicrobium sp.]